MPAKKAAKKTAKPLQRILVGETYSSGADGYNADSSYAQVEVTPALAKLILVRHKRFSSEEAADPALQEMSFRDNSANYFAQPSEAGANQTEAFASMEGQMVSVPENPFQGMLPENVSIARMVLSRVGVRWTASPKHSDIYVESPEIPFADIEKYL